jgi:uncharacterized 2Fe-2S/4Fe-4S cluster protein (DUF4445 family)
MVPVSLFVHGLASGKTWGPYHPTSLNQTLLDYLVSLGHPVASSCSGEGVCKKCVIQNDMLSCQYTIEEFMKAVPDGVVKIGYL